MKNSVKYYIAIVFIVPSIFGFGQSITDTLVLNYNKLTNDSIIPYAPCSSTNQIVNHHNYSLSYNETAEQAEWIFYKLTNSNSSSNEINRTNDFREDPFIKTNSSSTEDYFHSGYDRGHLAPAGSMKLNHESMSESFYMSNISPQLPGFNRGIWKRLEGKVRYWANANDSIFVVTGPILDSPIDTIGPNNVFVPRAFYKTVLAFKDGKAMGIAFLLPHEKSDKSLYSFATSIDSIEALTGIDFYCDLELKTQQKIETNQSVKDFIYK